jgi:hypothetical protein
MIKSASRRSLWLVSLILVTITALLISGGCEANQLPVISNLAIVTEGEVNPGGTAQLHCTAIDPEGDELSYTWSADGGTIYGLGATVSWTAPDELASYTITVEVSDGNDIATDQITITVVEHNHPPIIESLTTDCPKVRPAATATITCVASDPDGDELTYTWTTERGTISGEGAIVTWTAPGEYGNYLVTVTVSDGRGGEVTSSEVAPRSDGKISVCSCGDACQ